MATVTSHFWTRHSLAALTDSAQQYQMCLGGGKNTGERAKVSTLEPVHSQKVNPLAPNSD